MLRPLGEAARRGWRSTFCNTCLTCCRSYSSEPHGYVAHLQARTAVLVEGQEAAAFLQGLVTNDMRPLESPGSGPVYAALLTPKGKFLHDLFAYSLPGSPGHLLLDVDAAGRDHLLQWLTRYKLRRHIQLQDASTAFQIWAAWGGAAPPPFPPSHAAAAAAAAAAAGGGGVSWRPDPRLPQLGHRAVVPVTEPNNNSNSSSTYGTTPSPSNGNNSSSSSSSSSSPARQVPQELHQQLRYQLGVPEGDAEMPSEKVNPLEFNLDVLHGVSYTKGCYIGQERNSFTHFRGVLRRRLLPVLLQGQVQQLTGLHPGADVLHNGRSIGKLMAAAGRYGLAHLQLQPALALAASAAAAAAAPGSDPQSQLSLAANSGSSGLGSPLVGVVPVRPTWWPAEWGYEEQPAAGDGQ